MNDVIAANFSNNRAVNTYLFRPSRKIHNRNSKKIIGLCHSFKMNGSIPTESTLERDFLLTLEADPQVLQIVGQPHRFTVWANNRSHFFTPDFFVRWRDPVRRPVFFEVKPDDLANNAKWLSLFNGMADAADRIGCDFRVVRERDFRGTARLANAKRLRMAAAMTPNHHALARIVPYLPCAFGTLQRETDVELLSILNFLFHGELDFDRASPLTDCSLISTGLKRRVWTR